VPAREYNLKAYAAITWHNDPASPGLEPRLADHRSQAARTTTLPTAPPRQALSRLIVPCFAAAVLYITCDGLTPCTDELIRQVTINCAERGLLLLRVRDEIRITVAAYQTLYESSVAFGMPKALASEQGKSDLERKVWPLTFACLFLYHTAFKNVRPSVVRAYGHWTGGAVFIHTIALVGCTWLLDLLTEV